MLCCLDSVGGVEAVGSRVAPGEGMKLRLTTLVCWAGLAGRGTCEGAIELCVEELEPELSLL